jgi:putative ABC transport system permease protein
MIRFIKSFFKELKSNITISFINIIGYSFALASCLLIGIFIYNQLTYDKFHANLDNIYRLNYIQNKKATDNAPTNHQWYDVLPVELPGIEKMARYGWSWEQNLEFEKNNYLGNGVIGDIEIFEIFSFPVTEKQDDNFFEKPHSIAISESLAEKIFGEISPIGKNITLNYGDKYTVRAVFKDIPSNSTLQFDFITDLKEHLSQYGEKMQKHWLWWSWRTFILLNKGAVAKDIGNMMKPLQKKYIGEWHAETFDYYLQPLKKIHLDSSSISGSFDTDKSLTLIYVLASAGLLILLISCINYINLSIAGFESHKKSVAIKKIIGAGRKWLFKQYLSYSVVQTLFCIFLAVVLSIYFLSVFNTFQNSSIVIPFNKFYFWVILFVFGLFVGLLSGLYPAGFISKTVIISNSTKNRSQSYFRNGLITVQFTIAIILLISVALIKKQLITSTKGELGYDYTSLISFSATEPVLEHYQSFHNEMRKLAGVVGTTSCNFDLPGYFGNFWGVTPEGTDKSLEIFHSQAAPNFFDVLKIPVRNKLTEFTEDTSSASGKAVINAEASRQFGLGETILGKKYRLGDRMITVVGIIDDFHNNSTHVAIKPLQLSLHEKCWNFLVRLNRENAYSTIAEIQKIWNELEPKQPFEYQFVDDLIANQYTKEKSIYKLFNVFFVLAIILSMVGLFSLIQMILKFKTKEIGVRKVNGSKTREIVLLLNKEFVKWIIIAFLIACPVAWYIVSLWLENFVYKTDISWWIFVCSGFVATLVASITISLQSWRSARKNPVEALRYE